MTMIKYYIYIISLVLGGILMLFLTLIGVNEVFDIETLPGFCLMIFAVGYLMICEITTAVAIERSFKQEA